MSVPRPPRLPAGLTRPRYAAVRSPALVAKPQYRAASRVDRSALVVSFVGAVQIAGSSPTGGSASRRTSAGVSGVRRTGVAASHRKRGAFVYGLAKFFIGRHHASYYA